MSKEFIPYEQALALKELSFDEPCLGHYVKIFDNYQIFIEPEEEQEFPAPLYQQAFRWFREKGYGLIDKPFFSSKDTPNITYAKDIIHWSSGKVYKGARFNSYEETELDWLKRLIEIVNQNKDV